MCILIQIVWDKHCVFVHCIIIFALVNKQKSRFFFIQFNLIPILTKIALLSQNADVKDS